MIKLKKPINKKDVDLLERDIEGPVMKYARGKGFYAKKFVSPSNRSVPDDLFINKKGVIFFIEFKRCGRKPTPTQSDEHKKIRENNGIVYVVDNVEYGKEIIDEYC